MSKLNILVFLQAYSDQNPSNNPTLGNFKWDREVSGLSVSNPSSLPFSLAPGETKSVFSGSRTLSHDGTTQYSLTLKAFSSSTYVLTATSGTLPNFRTPRANGADATTQVTVTMNGPVATFASTGGTPLNMAAVVVGDFVRIGNLFNINNQGEWKIIAKTATSFSVENDIGVAEGPITLGAGFAAQIQIYSAAGVQVGDTILITGGFSPVTQGSYKITAVGANFLEFYSTDVLPQESNVQTQAIAIYSSAKQFIYIESDQKVSVTVNGSVVANIEPFVINNSTKPGLFLLKSTVYSLSVTNTSQDTANLFTASAE